MVKAPIIRSSCQAIKLSDIANRRTDFDLYLDLGNEVIAYTQGPHLWLASETEQLLQSGQFVLLYSRSDDLNVSSFLAQRDPTKNFIDLENSELVIADGISEFLKVLYSFSFSPENFSLVKSLAISLAKFIHSYSHLRVLCARLAAHDPFSFYHSARVAAYAFALGLRMQGPHYGRLWDLTLGSFLHDLGNLAVSAEVLNRQGPLNEEERIQIQRHPEVGLGLLEGIALTKTIHDIIFFHHERLDGGGYPRRLRGSMLSFEVRLVSFADAFAALTVSRRYQIGRSPTEALLFMEEHLLNFLDIKIFKAAQQLLEVDQVNQNQTAI